MDNELNEFRVQQLEVHIKNHMRDHREMLERLVRIETMLASMEIPKTKIAAMSGITGGGLASILTMLAQYFFGG